MIFSEQSDITIVITSCGRFELLKQTLDSLNEYNTYPINKIIITEDSGSNKIYEVLPQNWKNNCYVVINNQKLGQLKSIDLAYNLVDTKYIFHCEDDWVFYRSGFIEDSLTILELDDNVLQVWLRDYQSDVSKNYPFHYPSQRKIIGDISYSRLESNDPIWKGFSFNPGLRRKSDYNEIKPYNRNKSACETEGDISKLYYDKGMFAVILDRSAVEHIGWDSHILTGKEIILIRKKRIKKIKYIAIGFILGCIFMFFLK
ncbi:glycosyltransferase family 2 protein [Xenorhabdus bovienii]|uniref:glycosyltransferase family 2 protein n=1 Tax=Xenorhabdus bovienii TaxID=40576 RepID=UPI0023B354A0|nr:glycosyltransferase [Xenorhabdus bovienii]MDE9455781.1 glycosyltransferase family 2 protein [Xenorhabdus bovienii]MDE9565407.1 glycosyltransferase family 2 protein [Xenorhabdus bovienii]